MKNLAHHNFLSDAIFSCAIFSLPLVYEEVSLLPVAATATDRSDRWVCFLFSPQFVSNYTEGKDRRAGPW
jgi:hypothetical protein